MYQHCPLYQTTVTDGFIPKLPHYCIAIGLTETFSIGVIRKCVSKGQIIRLLHENNIEDTYNPITQLPLTPQTYAKLAQLPAHQVTLPNRFSFEPEEILSILEKAVESPQIKPKSNSAFRFARII